MPNLADAHPNSGDPPLRRVGLQARGESEIKRLNLAAIRLRAPTTSQWLQAVLGDFDSFLVDHAACERKAMSTGMLFVVRYPDRAELLETMIEFAKEELEHFQELVRLLLKRGLRPGPDVEDEYAGRLQKLVRHGRDERLLDRLIVSAIFEARGCERFGMLATSLPEGEDRELVERQHEDLRKAAERIRGMSSRLTLDAHMAWRREDRIVFDRVPLETPRREAHTARI